MRGSAILSDLTMREVSSLRKVVPPLKRNRHASITVTKAQGTLIATISRGGRVTTLRRENERFRAYYDDTGELIGGPERLMENAARAAWDAAEPQGEKKCSK